jgi:dUTP pyrophosphatase
MVYLEGCTFSILGDIMIIRFKKLHPDAVTPSYSREGDAAVDLVATENCARFYAGCDGFLVYKTGIAVEIPKGYVGIIYPRSSLSNYDLLMANHVGVIDSNYRGEIEVRFKQYRSGTKIYQNGDRIAQLIIQQVPTMDFLEVSTLTETNRGDQGFGSSGL